MNKVDMIKYALTGYMTQEGSQTIQLEFTTPDEKDFNKEKPNVLRVKREIKEQRQLAKPRKAFHRKCHLGCNLVIVQSALVICANKETK